MYASQHFPHRLPFAWAAGPGYGCGVSGHAFDSCLVSSAPACIHFPRYNWSLAHLARQQPGVFFASSPSHAVSGDTALVDCLGGMDNVFVASGGTLLLLPLGDNGVVGSLVRCVFRWERCVQQHRVASIKGCGGVWRGGRFRWLRRVCIAHGIRWGGVVRCCGVWRGHVYITWLPRCNATLSYTEQGGSPDASP